MKSENKRYGKHARLVFLAGSFCLLKISTSLAGGLIAEVEPSVPSVQREDIFNLPGNPSAAEYATQGVDYKGFYSNLKWLPAQTFTTGSHPKGYDLKSVAVGIALVKSGKLYSSETIVQMEIGLVDDAGRFSKIYSDTASLAGQPNHGHFIVLTFPEGVHLDPATRYAWVFGTTDPNSFFPVAVDKSGSYRQGNACLLNHDRLFPLKDTKGNELDTFFSIRLAPIPPLSPDSSLRSE